VIPIGQVVNHHDLAAVEPQLCLPTVIEGVVIDNQPVWAILPQGSEGLGGILRPGGSQPGGMDQSGLIRWWTRAIALIS
jgi:hypothetical protein